MIEEVRDIARRHGIDLKTLLAHLTDATDATDAHLFDMAPEPMLRVNVEDSILMPNAALAAYIKSTQKPLAPLELIEFIHPDDREKSIDAYQRATQSETTVTVENRYRCGDEGYRWFEWLLWRDEDLIYATGRDITEARLNHNNLQRDNDQVSTILESITDAFFALDSTWRFTYVNAEAEHLLMRPREELIGQNIWEIYADARNSLFYTKYHQAMSEQRVITFREYYQPLEMWFEVHVYPSGDGISVYFHDVTPEVIMEEEITRLVNELDDRVQARTAELEAANQRLREEEQRFRVLAENTIDLIALHAPDGTYLYLSPSVEALLGYRADEMLGTSPYEYFHPDEVETIREKHHKQALAGNKVDDVIYRIRHKDGHYIWFETYTSVVFDEPGMISQLVTISRDVTERKLAERNLRDALRNERELNTLKTRFMSMTSHEFRRPLSSIQAIAGKLRRYTEKLSTERIVHEAQRIETQVDDLISMLDGLLESLQANMIGLRFEPIQMNIADLLDGFLEEMRLLATPTHRLTLTSNKPCPVADLDPNLIRIIMANLISNAVKYSPDNPNIRLILTCAPERDHFSFAVQDEGIGIPADQLEMIFQDFKRGSNVRDIQGSGLGLAFTRQAVETHGGTISLDSVEGRGTTVTVRLPRHHSPSR